MTERVAFLMKDLVLLAVSFYLLKQDLVRVALSEQNVSPAASVEAAELGFSRR